MSLLPLSMLVEARRQVEARANLITPIRLEAALLLRHCGRYLVRNDRHRHHDPDQSLRALWVAELVSLSKQSWHLLLRHRDQDLSMALK